MFLVCEWALNDNLDASAAQQELKHEVIEGTEEQLPVRGHGGRGFEIAAECCGTGIKIGRSETYLMRGFEFLHDCRKT